MRRTHDDQMRALRTRIANPSRPARLTGSDPAPVVEAADVEPAVRLTRAMVDRAVARSRSRLAAGNTGRNFALAQGSMAAFLQTSRTIQRLPSFGRGLRS